MALTQASCCPTILRELWKTDEVSGRCREGEDQVDVRDRELLVRRNGPILVAKPKPSLIRLRMRWPTGQPE